MEFGRVSKMGCRVTTIADDGAGQNLLRRWNAAECVRVLQAGLSLARWW